MQITNAPDANKPVEFRALIGAQGDLAKVARFSVVIQGIGSITSSKDLAFLCESAEMPGRALSVDETRTYGPSYRTPFQSVYNEINLTFLLRNEMREKEFFDAWIDLINPKTTYDFAYRSEYATIVDIYQFDESNNAKYKVTLRHAYPININPLPMNWAEDNFHRLSVVMTYTDWVTPVDTNAPGFNMTPNEVRNGTSILGVYRV